MSREDFSKFDGEIITVRYFKYRWDNHYQKYIKIPEEATGKIAALTNQFLILSIFGTHKEIAILLEYIEKDGITIAKVENNV